MIKTTTGESLKKKKYCVYTKYGGIIKFDSPIVRLYLVKDLVDRNISYASWEEISK